MKNVIKYNQATLGKKDPKYGGILTDLSTLPVGTYFYVTNGCWRGRIVEIEGQPAVRVDMTHEIIPFYENPEHNILALTDIRKPAAA